MRLPPVFLLARMLLYVWHETEQNHAFEQRADIESVDRGDCRVSRGWQLLAVGHEGAGSFGCQDAVGGLLPVGVHVRDDAGGLSNPSKKLIPSHKGRMIC